MITGKPSKMEDGSDDPLHEMDVINNMELAGQVVSKTLAKIREVVEGIINPYEKYPVPVPQNIEKYIVPNFEWQVFEEARQAILKALDKKGK